MTNHPPAELSAQDVANWFIAWAEYNGEQLTVRQLHCLLYFAQAHHLASEGQPLFSDEIEARKEGPFVPTVTVSVSKRAVTKP